MPRGDSTPVVRTGLRERRSFAKIPEVLDVPNLIAIQRDSFKWFLDEGLRETFGDISPIEDFTGNLAVEFGAHEFGDPKYSVEECKEKDMSYQAPLFVDVRFVNRETGEMKEQSVFMGDFPLMTHRGTFVINGTERVVVSQLVRSPGVYYSQELDKTSDKLIYTAKVIPARGAWLEFETDRRDIVSVRVDRKRKLPVTVLLKALGIAETREDILAMFDDSEAMQRTLDRDFTETREEALLEIYKRLRPGEPPTVESARALLDGLFFNPQRYDLAKVGRYKLNKKLELNLPVDEPTLTAEDIRASVRYLVKLWEGADGFQVDDIDHFGNRRIRIGGRAHPEPVPHRPGPHGACRARAHDHAGRGRDHAAVADQHPADRRLHQGVLRFEPAVAVHGPDQPGRRPHPQAPPLGAGPRRPVPRARGLRGPRRAPQPLRPHVPDRDA